MADGGEDFEMEQNREWFRDQAYKHIDEPTNPETNPGHDDDTQYNTGENVENDSTFTSPGPAPRVRATEALDLQYTQNLDALKTALEYTGWKFTDTGLTKLSPHIYVEGTSLYYIPPDLADFTNDQIAKMNWRTNAQGGKVYIIPLTKADGKFYSENSLKKYGAQFVRNLKRILEIPDENIPLQPMTNMDNQPSNVHVQEVQTEETSFIEKVSAAANPIDKIIDTDDETLKSLGFTDNALRELRGLKKAGDDFAAVKQEKDRQIEQLEELLTKEKRKLIEETSNLFIDKYKLEKEIEKLEDQIIEEKHKVWQINMERESNLQRIKNIIRDVIKQPSSKIPLKDRIKLLFKVEGITIAAIVTAVIMTFTTIGLSISNSLRGKPDPPKPDPPKPDPPKPQPDPPKPDPSMSERIKEGLKKFAEWLKELAVKSAAHLPGIIGSIVSFILKSVGEVAGFMAEHVMLFLIFVVSSIVYGLVEGVKNLKKSAK